MTLRLTEAEAAKLLSRRCDREAAYAGRRDAKAKRSKMGNHKVVVAGEATFDSKAEHRRWRELARLVKAGLISDLQRQVPFELVPAQRAPGGRKLRALHYIADFTYRDKANDLVVEDVKGMETQAWRDKRKLMLSVHGIWVKEIKAS